jgi:plastocyanin/sugar lactone lactonase YvrE
MPKFRLPISLVLICIASLGLTPFAMFAQEATPAVDMSDSATILANDLTNPRGFAWGTDGSLYLALGGSGGDTQVVIEGTPAPYFVGPTSSIVTLDAGCPVPVAEDIASLHWTDPGWTWGAMDVVIFNGELYALLGGSGQPDMPNGIYRVLADGTLELVADLGAWNAENPTIELAWDDDPAGSWFDLEAGTDRLWATEAVRGRIVTVTTDGQIEQVVDLSEGHMVPTGLALDGEGGAYVGYETVVPFPDGGSKVSHVAADGTVTDAWTGLTAVTDVVIGPDGVLYAAEMATNNLDDPPYLNPGTGRIVRQTGPDSLEEVVTDIDYPAYFGFNADGQIILSTPAFGPDRGEGHGAMVQVDPASAPVSLANLDTQAPTCDNAGMRDQSAAVTAESAGEAVGTAVMVSIEDFKFNEETVEIASGTTVTSTNHDVAPHTVTSTDGIFDSGRMNEGETFSVTLTEPGEYTYFCEYHPGMQGTIVVKD